MGEIFARTAPPLWTTRPFSRSADEVGGDFARSLASDRDRIAEFSRRRASDITLHTILFGLLCVVLRAARRRVAQSDLEDDAPSSLQVLDHPFSLALVLALLPTAWVYPEMPLLLGWLVFALALPALIVVAREYTEEGLRPILYALGIFLLIDLVRGVISPFPNLSRLVFVGEMTLVVGFVAWLLRPGRLATFAVEEQRVALRTATLAVARVALVVCFTAALLECLGFQRLARVLGEGMLRSAYAGLLLYASARALHGVSAFLLRRRPLRSLRMVASHRDQIETRVGRILTWLALALWFWSSLAAFALWQPFASLVSGTLGARLEVGELSLSLGDVLAFGVTVWLSFVVAGLTRFVLSEEVFPRVVLARGVPYAVSTLAGYVVLFLGFLVAVAAAGVDFSRFTILAGAFGVGIGFGLQNVVNNFVSGLILLFERPVQVGDTLQLGEMHGEVRRIGIRSSTVRTWEGADVVVPNADLISQQVTNWTLADRNRRIELPVGVAYGSDPRGVVEVLKRVAADTQGVLPYPAPQALFVGFGDSSLDFVLRIWTAEAERWAAVRSELALAVHEALGEAGFEIPFPQRDLHVRTLPTED
ncbi:MAG: mechanosensitive ion channel [Myxococcales bacterium]|nr:mechanosensitive ion channel [Myxococcales bacterium]